MYKDFTLMLLSQHYPFSQSLQVLFYEDLFMNGDVADFLQTAEQQVSNTVLDNIYTYASAASATDYSNV